MDGRDTFLTQARENHYEFSSLRRAVYSTMCLTYDLHVQSQDFMYTCNQCKANVETRYHCAECEDFDLCKNCYQQVGHKHKMDLIGLGIDMGSPNTGRNGDPRNESVKRVIASLKHASQCKNANCHSIQCKQMKKVLHHAKSCRKSLQASTCNVCRRLIVLCIYHAKHCEESKCVVPFCNNFRMKFKIQEQENRRRQSQLLARRVAYMNNERPTNRGNSNEAQMNQSVCSGGVDIGSKAPRTPQQSDQPLTPSQASMMDPGTPGSQHGPTTPNSNQTMMKNSPHRRHSQQPAQQQPGIPLMNNLSPMQMQLSQQHNKNFTSSFPKASEKAMLAANQAKAIAASQVRPGTGSNLPHAVPPGMHHSMPQGAVAAQWTVQPRAPTDFIKQQMNTQVVVSSNNNLACSINHNPGIIHQNNVRARHPRGYYTNQTYQKMRRGKSIRAGQPMKTDEMGQSVAVMNHSQVTINPSPNNLQMQQNHQNIPVHWQQAHMRQQIPQEQYVSNVPSGYNQSMNNQRLVNPGSVNATQKLRQRPIFSMQQQQHRMHNQSNIGMSPLMQSQVGASMQGGNQQTMITSQQLQHTSPMMQSGMATPTPQNMGGMLPQQQNTVNITTCLPQMSTSNLVHTNNLTGPGNQMDQHFNSAAVQQQAQQQGNMMGVSNFTRTIQMNSRQQPQQVHTGMTYGVNPQASGQQADMLTTPETVDKFMNSGE